MISATEEQLATTNGNGGHGRWGHDFKLLVDRSGLNIKTTSNLFIKLHG